MKDEMLVLGYRMGWAMVKALPERMVRRMFLSMADTAFARRGKGVLRLEANLRRVRPYASEGEILHIARAGMRSYARYWMEIFRLPTLTREQVIARTHPHNEGPFFAAIEAGRGVVAALPHMANWDAAGAWICHLGVRFTTVAERLEPAEVFDSFVAFRESIGMEVIALTGHERPPSEVLAERLEAGGLVCLMADRDLTSSGIEVSFFGATARMPAGPATLAARTGAALIPVTLSYDDGGQKGLHIHFGDPVPDPGLGPLEDRVREMTQQMADVFAEGIAAHPEDWHMLQRLWIDDLEPRSPADPAAVADRP